LDFYDDEEYTGGDLLIANGYDKIADFLAEGIDVRLNTKIEGIDYSGERTEITTADQALFDADYVLLTVPLGVLKQNVISFSPPLPQRIQDPINKLEMGQVNKFLCVWDTAFWDTDLQYIGYTPVQRGKFNYFMNVKKFSDVNALMTFAFGDYSESTEGMSDAEVIEEIMGHLKAIFGPDIPNPTGFRRTKWSTNAFTFGSYSFAAQGARSSDFEQFEEAVDDKLFFAGEHTNRDYRGTVHGAYASGLREAEKIADLLC
jgi:monoamine oxidase